MSNSSFQFSLRSLLIYTSLVAVAFALLRWASTGHSDWCGLSALLGMLLLGALIGLPIGHALGKRRRTWVVMAFTSIAVGVVSGPYWMHITIREIARGPMHVIRLNETPPFLTDKLALVKAKEVMAADGYDLSQWKPMVDQRTRSPDGRPDQYLVRGTPDRGFVTFWNDKASNRARFVRLRLAGNEISAYHFRQP